jgi:integrase
MRKAVTLTIHAVRAVDGKRYKYWQLRWFAPNGKRHSENIGRVDEVSKRKADKLRQAKEAQLSQRPTLRNPGRVPTMTEFLDVYVQSRKAELAPGTIELHEQTMRYMKGYFGENRRIDQVTRFDAREFKTSLAKAAINFVNKRKHPSMSPRTVDLHIRNARTMFNRAVDDDLIMYNPFDRLSGGLPPIEKNWHYVNPDEFTRLLAACPSHGWKTLLGLCRLAGLRQGEALALQWRDVDWEKNRLTVWAPKTKRRRVVPIAPELSPLLRDAFENALEGHPLVVRDVVAPNVWRDFGVIRKRAGMPKYADWCHTLRKNRENDWIAAGFPFHVVVDWMGHSDEVARRHYLRVNENDIARATHTQIPTEVTQKVTQIAQNEAKPTSATNPQPIADSGDTNKAGDRIRTGDVQLGKLAFYH